MTDPSDAQPPSRSPDPGGWVAGLAAELRGAPLSPASVGALLRIARVVAHGSERVNAPLSTYVAGRYVAERVRAGGDEAAAIAEVEGAVTRLLGRSPTG